MIKIEQSNKIKRFFKKNSKKIIADIYYNNPLNYLSRNPKVDLKSSIKIRESTKKKIMILWSFIAIGGAEEIALNIVKYPAIRNEYDFVQVCLEEPLEYLGDLSSVFEELSYAFYKAENFQINSKILAKIKYLIQFHQIDILFIPNGSSFFYDAVRYIKKTFPNLRIINQVYDHQQGWINNYDYLEVSCIDCHVAPNELIKQAYINYNVPAKNITKIFHGINLENFNCNNYNSINIKNIKTSLQIPSDKIIVTFVGRIHSQKRPMDFLNLAKYFSQDSRFYFLIVGDGELSEQVETEIQNNELSNVTKISFQRPIQNVYLCTDIIVITSQYEGLPLVLLESLSMGIPAVATRVGAIDEVLKNGSNGFIIDDIADLNSFIQAIQCIAENLERFKNQCRKMRSKLSREFSIETMCRRYLNAFKG